jgi:hypothetical protein
MIRLLGWVVVEWGLGVGEQEASKLAEISLRRWCKLEWKWALGKKRHCCLNPTVLADGGGCVRDRLAREVLDTVFGCIL